MTLAQKVAMTAGLALIALTIAAVGYNEWWGSDADGVDRAFYPAGLVVGLTVAAAPVVLARRRRRRDGPR